MKIEAYEMNYEWHKHAGRIKVPKGQSDAYNTHFTKAAVNFYLWFSIYLSDNIIIQIIQILRRAGSRGTRNNRNPSFVVFEQFNAEQDGISILEIILFCF